MAVAGNTRAHLDKYLGMETRAKRPHTKPATEATVRSFRAALQEGRAFSDCKRTEPCNLVGQQLARTATTLFDVGTERAKRFIAERYVEKTVDVLAKRRSTDTESVPISMAEHERVTDRGAAKAVSAAERKDKAMKANAMQSIAQLENGSDLVSLKPKPKRKRRKSKPIKHTASAPNGKDEKQKPKPSTPKPAEHNTDFDDDLYDRESGSESYTQPLTTSVAKSRTFSRCAGDYASDNRRRL